MKLLDSKIIVIKVGSSLLIKNNKFDNNWLDEFALDVKFLRKKKIKVLIVASGAVSLGKKYLNIKKEKKLKINEKQACAACGQSLLMENFVKSFIKKNLKVAQILLTFSDTEERRKNLNARETINTLISSSVIPIINENDTIATEELRFGDNDRLAARVAQIINADNLILLSDVDGLYDHNPIKNSNAKLINIVNNVDKNIFEMATNDTNIYGSGGMKTKIEAAEMAMSFGCNTLICSGKGERPINRVINTSKKFGTWFISKSKNISSFKKWLASSIDVNGQIIIDKGAEEALNKGASLLPSGVVSIKGEFDRGDIVEVFSRRSISIGKGIVAYDCKEAKKILGKKTKQVESILGYLGRQELIHRDNLIIGKKK